MSWVVGRWGVLAGAACALSCLRGAPVLPEGSDTSGIAETAESTASTGTSGDTSEPAPQSLELSLQLELKAFAFTWTEVEGATGYTLLERRRPVAPRTEIARTDPGTRAFRLDPVALFDKQRASYLVEADRAGGPLASSPVRVPADLSPAIGFLKSPVPGENDLFGVRVALSADGSTLAVAATQTDTPPIFSHGTVYVFTRGPAGWEEEATLTASNQGSDFLGDDLGISADGTLIVVGASEEESADQGLGQDGLDDDAQRAGAAYAFRRDGLGRWREEAYLKASNAEIGDRFGDRVAVSADGTTVAIGAITEDSPDSEVDGDQGNGGEKVGAVYVFDRSPTGQWSQQAYLKASNAENGDFFGSALALDATGDTLVVGASGEDGAGGGVNGDGSDNSAEDAGAAFVFLRDQADWEEVAYLKAAKPGKNHRFGAEVATDADGSVVLVTATLDDRGRVHVFDRQGDRFVSGPSILGPRPEDVQFGSHLSMAAGGRLAVAGANGAVHVLVLDEARGWEVFDTLVPPVDLGSPSARDFGRGVALSADGTVLAVGDQRDNSGLPTSGAVYIY